MKMKRIAVLALVMLAALMMVSAVWAGERSKLLSEQELKEIQLVAEAAYPPGTKLCMVVGDGIFGSRVEILFLTGDDRQYLGLELFPLYASAVIREHGSREILDRAGDKIIAGIERILNCPASDPTKLGRNHLERQGIK